MFIFKKKFKIIIEFSQYNKSKERFVILDYNEVISFT